MAIRDLLWACPACGTPDGLASAGRVEACRQCQATVRRGPGATIVVQRPGAPAETRPAWEWCDRLPTLTRTVLSGRVLLREADAARPLRDGHELLGFVERFGPARPGRLELSNDALTFAPDAGQAPIVWPLLDVTAIQPASSALQIKLRGRPVMSLKFLDSSVRLWEQGLQQALRAAYRAAGRGEIVEFQPRVSAR